MRSLYSLSLLVLSSLTLLHLPPVLSSPTPIPPIIDAGALGKRYPPQGTISTPANGTIIMPGEAFDFYYNQRGDYCLESLNFSVWLLTSPPESLLGIMTSGDDSEDGVTGWYFGRFSYSSWTNHYPPNPAPSQLTMPDLSQPPSGIGIGESADSVPMYLAVLEEWNPCEATLGHRLSLTANTILYNATSVSTGA